MIKHILSGGCSFTADGIGGAPPESTEGSGNCSFVHGSVTPLTWTGFIAQALAVSSMVNVAGLGFSNSAIAQSMIYMLENYAYRPQDTLVLFNVTDPGRLGTICSWDYAFTNRFTPWSPDLIPWTVMERRHGERDIVRAMGIEQVEARTSFDLRALLDYLELRSFRYRFMMMMDYRRHALIGDMIAGNGNLVLAHPGGSMFDYAMITDQLDADGQHPGITAHQRLADQVLATLEI